jgi:hypothetical protein
MIQTGKTMELEVPYDKGDVVDNHFRKTHRPRRPSEDLFWMWW